ncbi:DUF4376 domain-containing protein [Vibrio fluvialis]|uniref:DUF4376 domain-containing protein n=1 Tax=Vibrio fluvialis TaxID=676 RepID=UPI0005C8F406|nr:DUF4376 domain-containing protein [Vibrio fluvialis]
MFDNTKGTLQSVPSAIREFYHEETRREPTGNKVSESYTYQNEAGESIPAERLVDEYADITYLVQNSRSDLKSWDDVELAKAKSTYDTTRYFIEKACEGELWSFHDAYLAWLENEPSLDDDAFFTPGEGDDEPTFNESWFEAALDAWENAEPEKSVTSLETVLAEYHQALAKQYRESVIEGNIVVHGVEWQINKEGRDNMNEAIAYAVRNSLPGTTPRQWILADNSLRETTVDELRSVLNAYAERLDAVFESYAVWREGDKLVAFSYG